MSACLERVCASAYIQGRSPSSVCSFSAIVSVSASTALRKCTCQEARLSTTPKNERPQSQKQAKNPKATWPAPRHPGGAQRAAASAELSARGLRTASDGEAFIRAEEPSGLVSSVGVKGLDQPDLLRGAKLVARTRDIPKLGLSRHQPQTCIEACPSCGVLGDGTILRIVVYLFTSRRP